MRTVTFVCMGLATSVSARAQPYIGTAKISVKANASFKTYARGFNPTFNIKMTAAASPTSRRVEIVDKEFTTAYACTLTADVQGATLNFPANQTCRLAIATPDFCLLKQARCDTPLTNLQCASEKAAGNLDVLSGNLTAGSASTGPNNSWKLELAFVVSGCVLVNGRNNNRPIEVRGGVIRVAP